MHANEMCTRQWYGAKKSQKLIAKSEKVYVCLEDGAHKK